MLSARMDSYCCLKFIVALKIIDDQYLDIIKEDIQRYYDINSDDIRYRWSPSSMDINSTNQHILVYFYWQNHNININPKCVEYCFKKRFGYLVKSSSFIKLKCPSKIPITELCMLCKHRKCNNISNYGWIVRISVTSNLCSDCQQIAQTAPHNDTATDIEEYKFDKTNLFNTENNYNNNNNNNNYIINNDSDKLSFQFQLIMHESFMQFINPSIRSKEKLKREVITAIGQRAKKDRKLNLLPPAFKRAYDLIDQLNLGYYVADINNRPDIKAANGILNSHSNQLIREHKARKIRNQMTRFNFKDHPDKMRQIIWCIENEYKSADSWFWHMPRDDNIIESMFDLMDIIKQLVLYKFGVELVIDHKFRIKKLPQQIKDNKNWYNMIKSAMILDCDSTFRQWRTKLNSSSAEKGVSRELNKNGYKHATEPDQRSDPNHDIKNGTPDILFNLLKKPLKIRINGKRVIIYWIDVKYECCCITNEHRNKLRQQAAKYVASYGVGAFVFTNGYIADLNIGDNVVTMSLTWLKRNIPNINEYTKKPIITDENYQNESDEDEKIKEYFSEDQDEKDDNKCDVDDSSDDFDDDSSDQSVDSDISKDSMNKPKINNRDISNTTNLWRNNNGNVVASNRGMISSVCNNNDNNNRYKHNGYNKMSKSKRNSYDNYGDDHYYEDQSVYSQDNKLWNKASLSESRLKQKIIKYRGRNKSKMTDIDNGFQYY